MKFLKWLIAMFRNGTPGFCPLEVALLDEAMRHLDADRADKLRRRIQSINLVQRLDGGREVNSYAMKNGKHISDDSMQLTDGIGEQKLAKFSFRGANDVRYKGCIWLVNGRFFSIEFDKATEHALDDPPTDLKLVLCI